MTDVTATSLGMPELPAPDYPADVRARLEADARGVYCGSVYRLECYAAGWILRADGVAISAPIADKAAAIAALDAVAPFNI